MAPQPPEKNCTLRCDENEVVLYVQKVLDLVGDANCGSDQENQGEREDQYGLCDCYLVYIPYTLDRSTLGIFRNQPQIA